MLDTRREKDVEGSYAKESHLNQRLCYYVEWWEAANTLGYETVTDMMTDLYITKQMSPIQISKKLGWGDQSVRRLLKRIGIKIQPKGWPNIPGEWLGREHERVKKKEIETV